jgi:two-component system response regulator AtoC
MAPLKIFIVEDDAWFGEMLKHHLSLNPDYQVTLFKTSGECLQHLRQKPDIVTVDFGLPDMPGDVLMERIHAVDKNIPVIVISGQEEVSVAVDFLKKGARDYVMKDDHTREMLWNAILRIRETLELKQEVATLKGQLEQKFSFEKSIVGQSPALKTIFPLIEKAIGSNINVSVTGETGTGKEVVAKAIHYNSERKNKPFVAVNMAAIPSELAESELFGYEKGAFTGANSRRIGRFEEANGGTLFLDEIGELDLSLQSKLLRVIQERELVRVGGNQKVKVDLRLITATHKNLAEEVKKGHFREDLFYRVMGLQITLPPLRERGHDILLLAKYFADDFAKENHRPPLRISEPARERLMKYNYPGNVRELRSVMELACVMSDGSEIGYEDLRFTPLEDRDVFKLEEKTLKEYTNDLIGFFLKKYQGDVLEVARRLDISKSRIYELIRNNEINLD